MVKVDGVLLVGGQAAGAGFVEAFFDVFDVLGVLGVGERFGECDVLQAWWWRLAAAVGFGGGGRVAGGEPLEVLAEVAGGAGPGVV